MSATFYNWTSHAYDLENVDIYRWKTNRYGDNHKRKMLTLVEEFKYLCGSSFTGKHRQE